MKKILKYRNDILLGVSVLLVAGIAAMVYALVVPEKTGTVVVKVAGKVIGNYPLSKPREILLETEYGTNLLVIKDGEAYLKEADCPDQLCVKQGKISRSGKMIICLPHRLTIEVVNGEESGIDGIAQ